MKNSQDMINSFLAHLEHVRQYSKYTLRSYGTDLWQFLGYLTDRELINLFPQSITQKDVRAYLTHLRRQGFSEATVSRKLTSLRSFYRWMLRQKMIDHNPTRGFASPRVDRTTPRTLTEQQVLDLISSANRKSLWGRRDLAILVLLSSMGMKIGELVALNWAEVDLDKYSIFIWDDKGRRTRTLTFPWSVRDLLARYSDSIEDHPRHRFFDRIPVFINKQGTRLTARSIGRIVEKYAKRAGLPKWVSPQTLRHSMASHMLDRGANIEDIRVILGHQSVETTKIYTKIREKVVLDANSGS